MTYFRVKKLHCFFESKTTSKLIHFPLIAKECMFCAPKSCMMDCKAGHAISQVALTVSTCKLTRRLRGLLIYIKFTIHCCSTQSLEECVFAVQGWTTATVFLHRNSGNFHWYSNFRRWCLLRKLIYLKI